MSDKTRRETRRLKSGELRTYAYDTERVNIYMPTALLVATRRRAHVQGLTLSAFVRSLIYEAVESGEANDKGEYS